MQDTYKSLQEYAQRLAEAEAKLSRSQADLKHLQEKESRFRSIILDKSGSQSISDADIIDAFVKLRQKAQGVLKKEYFGQMAVNKSILSRYGKDHHARTFLAKIDSYPARKDRVLYARARVFRLLNTYIFQLNTFGVVGLPLKTKRKENVCQQMEDYLSSIEDFMKDEDGEDSSRPVGET